MTEIQYQSHGGPSFYSGWYWRTEDTTMPWQGPYRYEWQAYVASFELPWRPIIVAACIGFTVGAILKLTLEYLNVL